MRNVTTPLWIQQYTSTAEGISRLFYPHVEVAILDIESDTIAGIWNPFSGRKIGDPALLDDLTNSKPDRDVFGPYTKVLTDGRSITSVSSLITNEAGKQLGLLCINFDRSALDNLSQILSGFLSASTSRPAELFSRDWREQIALAVDEECQSRRIARDKLKREDRRAIVQMLEAKGLFETRQAAEHVAKALNVSRATIYHLLKEVRS